MFRFILTQYNDVFSDEKRLLQKRCKGTKPCDRGVAYSYKGMDGWKLT